MTRFEYQQHGRFFAQVAGGQEPAAAGELGALGAVEVEETLRGIYFTAERAALYRIHYQSRLVMRLLAPLISFRCENRDDLYRAARGIAWPAIFSPAQTFGVFANVSGNRNLNHSKFAALCVKDAVADAFRDEHGERPNVDRRNPDIWIHLHITDQQATISLDTSGGSLHRRGYRRQSIEAPMQETLAAAILALSGWQGEQPLYDPMCGSGTLLCEALMHLCHIPAGYLRARFGLHHLPDFDRKLWEQVKREADGRIVALRPGWIAGSDIDPRAVRATVANLGTLPGGASVAVRRAGFNDLPELEKRLIVCNPPYGLRSGRDIELNAFYKAFGDFLKQRCTGAQAYVYFGNREMLKQIGLRPAWKKPLRNADLDGRLAKFELY